MADHRCPCSMHYPQNMRPSRALDSSLRVNEETDKIPRLNVCADLNLSGFSNPPKVIHESHSLESVQLLPAQPGLEDKAFESQ